MNSKEMEVTNFGIVGSLEPIAELLDAYSNNSEDRKNLIIAQLTSNPFNIKIPESSNKAGNDNMMLNAYLGSMGLVFEKGYEETSIDRINTELTADEVVILGMILEVYNAMDKSLDIDDFIDDVDKYKDELAEYHASKEVEIEE